MLKKFVDWWNRRPAIEGSNPQEANSSTQEKTEEVVEEEFVYETTIKEDLAKIYNILNKMSFLKEVDILHISEESDKIYFSTRKGFRYTGALFAKFKTLDEDVKKFGLYFSNKSSDRAKLRARVNSDYLYYAYKTNDYWVAEYSEYKKIYKTSCLDYATEVIEPLRKEVKKNYHNQPYYYIFLKYEDSIHIVLNALKESEELNGQIDEDVLKKAIEIIDKFKDAMSKKSNEIKYIEELQNKVTNKSHIERLDNELEFIDKYIEKTFDKDREAVKDIQ